MELFLAWFGAVTSFVGIVIGIYTLWKVSSVRQAQLDERRITEELIGVDQIELDLRRVISKLTESNDQESAALAMDLSVKLGAIQGARRAMDSPTESHSACYARLERGFYDHEFLVSHIDRAHRNIDILTGRTLLVAGYDIMDRLRRACERGVEVRIIGFSEDGHVSILEDALRTVANPAPANAEDYRRQIIQCKKDIVENVGSWPSAAVRQRFQFRVNSCVPRISLVRTDNNVSIGFLQLYRDAQPKELKDREYLKVLATSGIGQVAMKHFDIAFKEATLVFPPSVEDSQQPLQLKSKSKE